MDKTRFQKLVLEHYKQHGRALPWRKTRNAYRILLSELMLQQTQAERVIPKYNAFIKYFPTLASLQKASLKDVLELWQGLGYNRRAKYILDIAKKHSTLPKTYEELLSLSGVGPYTAAAVMNFAYNTATPMIETNIRTVYLHHFFKNQDTVADRDILKRVEETMDSKDPKVWFNALMDYGAYIKKVEGNPNAKSKHYTRQSSFKGSRRQVRGHILRLLTEKKYVSKKEIQRMHKSTTHNISSIISDLERENLIACTRDRCSIYT